MTNQRIKEIHKMPMTHLHVSTKQINIILQEPKRHNMNDHLYVQGALSAPCTETNTEWKDEMLFKLDLSFTMELYQMQKLVDRTVLPSICEY